MSKILMPAREEILRIAQVRSDICVSIYIETSPLRIHADACRIELGNLISRALAMAEEKNLDKRRLASLREELEDILSSDNGHLFQANSLAILATPDNARVYRLANHLNSQLEISDRFHIKPLLRAHTFAHRAYILALSDNATRVIELFPDSAPEVLSVPGMPRDASQALGVKHLTASVSDPAQGSGSSMRKRRLAEYSRQIDEAMRPLVQGTNIPVILVATNPLASIFRSVATVTLAGSTILTSPDRLPDHELVALARPVLDAWHEEQLREVRALFEQRAGEKRVATQLPAVARAATYGMVSLIMVDFDRAEQGFIDEGGGIVYSDAPSAYGLVDEIVKRSLEGGADVLAVRGDDMVGDSGVAAVLRYPLMRGE